MSTHSLKPNRHFQEFSFFDSEWNNPLAIETKMTSKPILLILHGLFGGLSNFDAVVDDLKSDFRMVILSFPFFDQDHLQTIPQLSKYVFRFIESVFPNEPIHLIGNSLGGQIAIHLCLHHKDTFVSLILTGSAGLTENSFGCSKPKRFSVEYIKERVKDVFFSYELDQDSIQSIQDVLINSDQCGRLLKLARNSKNTHLGHHLHEIKQPVLLIWGENDDVTPPSVANQFCSSLTNAHLKWIPECGHAPMMEHPSLFATYCHYFLTQQLLTIQHDKNYV
jgi:pimeloyl-ACP methyl ester carboxylesterase